MNLSLGRFGFQATRGLSPAHQAGVRVDLDKDPVLPWVPHHESLDPRYLHVSLAFGGSGKRQRCIHRQCPSDVPHHSAPCKTVRLAFEIGFHSISAASLPLAVRNSTALRIRFCLTSPRTDEPSAGRPRPDRKSTPLDSRPA